MSYNPGGWSDDKLKWYGIIFLILLAGVLVAQWAGWIDMGPPPQVPK